VLRYIRKMTVTTDSLYEEDFYAWTQEQAKLLRRLPAIGNEFDPERIAEEIEDLGRSELHAARSLCEHLIEHFLKPKIPKLNEPNDHWRDEIVEWRLQLEKILTRSIEAKLDCRAVSGCAEAGAPARMRRRELMGRRRRRLRTRSNKSSAAVMRTGFRSVGHLTPEERLRRLECTHNPDAPFVSAAAISSYARSGVQRRHITLSRTSP
jgi:hypothetical protein